jgi:hypothetical protein
MSRSALARYLISPASSSRDWIAWFVAVMFADTAHSLVDAHHIWHLSLSHCTLIRGSGSMPMIIWWWDLVDTMLPI